MFPKYNLNKYGLKKKNLIFLILHIHFLIFLLIAVLWSRHQFKKKFSHTPPNTQTLERKAQFLLPLKDDKKLKNNER